MKIRYLPVSRAIKALMVLAVALPLGGISSIEALFAPSAKLWERWTANDPAATRSIDHGAWDRFLKAYVLASDDGVNRVAYGRVTSTDRLGLKRYITRLAVEPVSRLSRAEQLPLWINLYNALTVKLVLDHYPVKSIRDIGISPGWIVSGPWNKKLIEIEGEQVSLNDIEHRILRPIWRDPRIHYAVNCASIGCPNLRTDAFTAKNADNQLSEAAHLYVNHRRGARIEDGKLVVSSIYVWFQEDFGGDDKGVIAHLARYAGRDLKTKLAKVRKIADFGYDWALNGPPAGR
jgi:hypothetical protein